MADTDNPPVEPVDGNKLIEDAANAGGEPAEPKPPEPKPEPDKPDKPAEVDWKEKAEAIEKQFKEYQRGITPKLQKLAELEKSPDFVEQLVEKLSGKTDSAEESKLPDIQDEINSIDAELGRFKDAGYEDDTYEVRALKRDRYSLVRQLKREKEWEESQGQTKMIGDYLTQYPNPTPEHITELTEIVAEKRKQGKNYDLLDAEEIWRGRQADTLATQRAEEARQTKDKADGARTQDGAPVEPKKPEDEEMSDYRNIIAPPGDPIVFPTTQ